MTGINPSWHKQVLTNPVPAATLAVFRIAFGLMIFLSIIRFWINGWIETLYIQPRFFFSYYGFEWVKPLGPFTYLLFAICGLSALGVALGWKYRFSAVVLFLSFTYIELMDKTTYLNHYYFVSLISLVIIFLPMQVCASLDARRSEIRCSQVPAWTVNLLKLFLAIVYFYAGLAKLNSDWLLHAMPLKLWLPAQNSLPLLGPLLNMKWIPYIFSWFGALYDLSIPFLLLWRPTRPMAYLTVLIFHTLTAVLFQIGMFPYVMIVVTLIFFSGEFHTRILQLAARFFRLPLELGTDQGRIYAFRPAAQKGLTIFFCLLIFFQLVIPFRYLLYPGELFWTEEGYRFSWRVMLMEKAGYATFHIVDATTGKHTVHNNSDNLTALQEKMMATQPDMLVQYAHFLRKQYITKGFDDPQVFAEVYVTLNGRQNAPYIDPNVDLSRVKESFKPKPWILPFNDTIKGF